VVCGDEGYDEERRQGDQHVDKATHDHAANSPHRRSLDRRRREFLHKPDGLAAVPPKHLEDAVGLARTGGTQVGQHKVAADAVPDEPAALASGTRSTADIAGRLACSGAAHVGSR
jgi:hypothetical protein